MPKEGVIDLVGRSWFKLVELAQASDGDAFTIRDDFRTRRWQELVSRPFLQHRVYLVPVVIGGTLKGGTLKGGVPTVLNVSGAYLVDPTDDRGDKGVGKSSWNISVGAEKVPLSAVEGGLIPLTLGAGWSCEGTLPEGDDVKLGSLSFQEGGCMGSMYFDSNTVNIESYIQTIPKYSLGNGVDHFDFYFQTTFIAGPDALHFNYTEPEDDEIEIPKA